MKIQGHNIEAEQSLLATLMINNEAFEHCSEIMPIDFYKTAHQIIYKKIIELLFAKNLVDLVVLTNELTKAGQIDQIGGVSYLVKVIDTAPIMNTAGYVKIIKEYSLTRQINQVCMKIQDSSLVGDTLLDIAQSEMLKIQSSANQDCIVNVRDIIHKHIDRIEKANTQQQETGYQTGFSNIDQRLKLSGSKLIIIAGRPRMGKTSLAVTIARNFDKTGVCVGFMSIEMPEDEIMDKWLSMESGVDSCKFGRYKGLNKDEYQVLNSSAESLFESKLMLDETGSLDIVDVERKARKMKTKGAQVLIIDQLSQIGNKYVKSGETTSRYSVNCNRIARLKKELKIPIFLLAQLNRDLEKRNNKEPMLSDLKQTGSLEEDADAILFVHRPEEYAVKKEERTALRGIAVLNLAKNRSGPCYRDERIIFVQKTTRFFENTAKGI